MIEEYLAKMTAMITSDFGTDKDEIGTGFPVFSGMVITARHCLFRDNNEPKSIQVEWPDLDVLKDAEIIFECTDADIAILSCITPEVKHKDIIVSEVPPFSRKWCSWGYPEACYDEGKNISKLGSASGTLQPVSADKERRISIIGDVAEESLWMGASGAPVFEFNEEIKSYNFIGIKLKALSAYQNSLNMISIHEALKDIKLKEVFDNFSSYGDGFIIPVPDGNSAVIKNITNDLVDILECQDEAVVLPFLSVLRGSTSTISDIRQVAESLVNKKPVIAIYSINNACGKVLRDKRNKVRKKNKYEFIEMIEAIISRLSILNVEFDDVSKLSPYNLFSSSLYFKMGSIETISGVEIVLSRRFNRFPNFKGGPEETLKAEGEIKINEYNFKWDEDETVNLLKKAIWNTVFERDSLDLSDQNVKLDDSKKNVLNSTIKSDREVNGKQRLISIDVSNKICDSGFKNKIFEGLMEDLNQLTFIEFNSGDKTHVYIKHEHDIVSAISDFYRNYYSSKPRDKV